MTEKTVKSMANKIIKNHKHDENVKAQYHAYWKKYSIRLSIVTGPYYDFSMETSFGLEKGILQKYRPTKDSLFSDVTDILNLGVKVIWTYHPTFLNRKHKIDYCINYIVNAIK